jgi:hypothetical protein
MSKTDEAETILLKLMNGLKYFDKYYCRLSRTYHCINYGHYETLKDFCFTQYWKIKDEEETYNMEVFLVILKDLRFLMAEYKNSLDLEPTLYSEFIKMNIQRVWSFISRSFSELLAEPV